MPCPSHILAWSKAIYSFNNFDKAYILHPFCMLFQHRVGINFTLRNRPNRKFNIAE